MKNVLLLTAASLLVLAGGAKLGSFSIKGARVDGCVIGAQMVLEQIFGKIRPEAQEKVTGLLTEMCNKRFQ